MTIIEDWKFNVTTYGEGYKDILTYHNNNVQQFREDSGLYHLIEEYINDNGILELSKTFIVFGYFVNFRKIVHNISHPAKIWSRGNDCQLDNYYEWWINGKNKT